MYSKSVAVEQPYSRDDMQEIKKVFAELRKMGKTKEAHEYVRKVRAGLRA